MVSVSEEQFLYWMIKNKLSYHFPIIQWPMTIQQCKVLVIKGHNNKIKENKNNSLSNTNQYRQM
jgi:hypothetical protein